MFGLELRLFFKRRLPFVLGIFFLFYCLFSLVYASNQFSQAKQSALDYQLFRRDLMQRLEKIVETNFQQGNLSQEDYDFERDFLERTTSEIDAEIQAIEQEDWAYFYRRNSQRFVVGGQLIGSNYEGYDLHSKTIEKYSLKDANAAN